ncbi:uncharacterized protein LOC100890505 [Strongylocentrotus purpuratus]|uniref:Protein quiver n=1 Tax=Strongylocentrotus purpuratus TaxID=7668 RepID=A0A7M7GH62_STRPU|nr:uncharacterized protein LOC100890505 [Strongylocentrotus purpuratus]
MTMMKAQVFLLVAVLSFRKVQAQQCYQCSSYTADLDISTFTSMLTSTGIPPCDENYQQTSVNCSAEGGCLKTDYDFEFEVQGLGRVSVAQVIRTCGAPADECESASELAINAQRDVSNAVFPSTIQFVSGSGRVCVCSDNLCNRAHATTLSLGALLASLLVSYIAMKQ